MAGSFSKQTEKKRSYHHSLLILMAVAADAVIMNRLRNVWARSEHQVTTEIPELGKQEEGSHVP